MSTASNYEHDLTTLRQLYPELSDDQLREANYNLKHYASLVYRIATRLESEKQTRRDIPATIKETEAKEPSKNVQQTLF